MKIFESTLWKRLEYDGTPIYLQPETPLWLIPNASGDRVLQEAGNGGNAIPGGDPLWTTRALALLREMDIPHGFADPRKVHGRPDSGRHVFREFGQGFLELTEHGPPEKAAVDGPEPRVHRNDTVRVNGLIPAIVLVAELEFIVLELEFIVTRVEHRLPGIFLQLKVHIYFLYIHANE